MRLLRYLTIAMLAAVPLYGGPFCDAAFAQQSDITGAWSWQVNTPQGPIASTLFIRPDGGFVRVDRLSSGTMLRQWGQYRATPVGPDAFRLETQIQGYLPHTSCIAIAGMGRRCDAAPPAQPLTTILTVTSATTIESDGSVLRRDLSGGLLNVPVPDTAVIAGITPTRPNIQQPVMPPQTRYQTPNGPGNQMANQFHHDNENFSQGYMRGCVKDMYGHWVGCQQ
jgi:hypothetical protein